MRIRSMRTACAVATCGLLALAGCERIDPLTRPYMWHPMQVNAQNIAAMAANPSDLTHGRDSKRRGALMDADSVNRLWAGKPLPLLGGGSSGGGAAGGGP